MNSINQIFNKSLKGGIITTGNTCTIAKDNKFITKNFIAPNDKLVDKHNNIGSSCFFNLPKNSKIILAILEWHSTNIKSTKNIDGEIQLTTPSNINLYFNISDFNSNNYVDKYNNFQSSNWLNITKEINSYCSGKFTLQSIPFDTLDKNTNNFQSPGWTLTIIYENLNMPLRNITLSIGLKTENIEIDRKDRSISINSLNTSKKIKKSYLTLVASNGNPNSYCGLSLYSDSSLFDNMTNDYFLGNIVESKFKNPNCKPIVPYDNIFSGIIMNTNTEDINYSSIDINGTLGNKNNIPYDGKSNYIGNRTDLDILSFDISNKISQNQKQFYLIPEFFSFNKNNFINIILISTQIDIKISNKFINDKIRFKLNNNKIKKTINQIPFIKKSYPQKHILNQTLNSLDSTTKNLNISILKTPKNKFIALGDELDYTIEIINNDNIDINNVVLIDNIPTGSSLVSGSLTGAENILIESTLPLTGIPLSTIKPNNKKIINYKVIFYEESLINSFSLNPKIKYNFIDNGIIKDGLSEGLSNNVTVITNPIERIDLFTNKLSAFSDEKIIYSLILRNNGIRTAKNIKLSDKIPNGLNFVANSLKVDGIETTGDITNGVYINDIPPNKEVLVSFEVSVK